MLYRLKYTDQGIPERFAGWTVTFFIKIRPLYQADVGLLEHEKLHVRQFWRTLGLYCALYPLWKKYRLGCEVEAYREQLRYNPLSIGHFATRLATCYGLNITTDEAIELLK